MLRRSRASCRLLGRCIVDLVTSSRVVLALSSCLALIAPALSGCVLSRGALGSARSDGGTNDRDAYMVEDDVGNVRDDVGTHDGGPDDDAALDLDASGPDGGVDVGTDAGPPCVPTGATESACDRIDDDCDGTIDDGVCGACTAFTVGGRAYLSCPGPVSGFDAWAGACRRLANGYDLAQLESPGELAAVAAALATTRDEAHWIGLNSFEHTGTWVWRDRTTSLAPSTIGSNDPATPFGVLGVGGVYAADPGNEAHAVLCEGMAPPGHCGAPDESAPCDAVDDDCDGVVDEGAACGGSHCVASTFWDHVYWWCDHDRNAMQASTDCGADTAGTLAVLDHATEHAFVATLSANEGWLSLRQGRDQATTSAGWQWADRTSTYGIPAMVGVAPWSMAEPNDGTDASEDNDENCALMTSDTRANALDDRACSASLDFVCEATWTW